MAEGLDAAAGGFVHDKELVPGLTAWACEDLKVPDEGQFAFFCPEEVERAAGPAAVAEAKAEAGTAEGKRLQLTRGFQGPNGTRYRTTFATFEHFHQTGNIVLQTLPCLDASAEGVVV